MCNNAACDFDSGWCTYEARAEVGRAQLSALSGETSAAVSRLAALVNLTSEFSPEQQSIVRRAHRMVDSLKHGMVLGLPPNEVGVLSFEAYTSRVERSAKTLKWLDEKIQYWDGKKSSYAKAAVVSEDLKQGLNDMKQDLETAVSKLDSRLEDVAEELQVAIASVDSQVRLVRDQVFANGEAIHRVQHRLGGLSDEMRGISMQLSSVRDLLRNPPSNSPSSPSHFPWDADQNGRVEREELDRLVADFELAGHSLAEVMSARFSEFTHPSWGELLKGEFSSTSSIGDELVAYFTERGKLPDSLVDELLGSATVLQSAKVCAPPTPLFSLPLPSSALFKSLTVLTCT